MKSTLQDLLVCKVYYYVDGLEVILFAFAACLEAIIKGLEKDNMFTKGDQFHLLYLPILFMIGK